MGESQMKNRPVKMKKLTDPFGSFKQSTSEAFKFLMNPGYGFTEDETIVHPPECNIRYRNATTGVTVSYEWGGSPSVVLTKLDRRGRSVWDGEQIGLKFLVMERCPTVVNRFEPEYGNDPDELLIEYARILEECGQDILGGNFKDFPKLKRLVLSAQRKANLEMFGSETGETS
jgi:hypothetical protein